jgi:hypothetical protein
MRDTLRELAAEQPSSSPAFADRVLADRRRHRNRRLVSVATATTVVRPAHVVQNGGVRAAAGGKYLVRDNEPFASPSECQCRSEEWDCFGVRNRVGLAA